ncbi:MAG TPA: WSC domain-containing protein, partial [Casimicrobiaceae bacterium]|nr:WSC domain-containing protein [Casimicrobiaceae bacterium]
MTRLSRLAVGLLLASYVAAVALAQGTANSAVKPGEVGTQIAQPRGGASFIGCFKDTDVYDLNGYLQRSPQNTPQRCIATCQAKGFAYAGVQYGESCLCGNRYGKYGAANNCNVPCTGDRNQTCGGNYANSVYATGVTITTLIPPPTAIPPTAKPAPAPPPVARAELRPAPVVPPPPTTIYPPPPIAKPAPAPPPVARADLPPAPAAPPPPTPLDPQPPPLA